MADGSLIVEAAASFSWPCWVRHRSAPLRRNFQTKVNASLSVVDLFSGCGGMTLGVWEAARQMGRACDVRLAVDFNSHAIEVYRDNFRVSNDVAMHADVRAVMKGGLGDEIDPGLRRLVSRVGHVDVLVAGPPCQGHSDLNNHSRRYDPRNDLYLSAVRGVEVFSPDFVLIENVPAAIHDRNGVTVRAKSYLESIGYRVTQAVIDISIFGVPQRRKRHVTLASKYLSSGELNSLLQVRSESTHSIKDFIGELEDEAGLDNDPFRGVTRLSPQNVERIRWLFENDAYDLPDRLRPACHRDRSHSYKSMYGRMRWDRAAQTLTTGFGSMGQGRYVHPSRERTLTCHEAARIQGFPDFFSFASCSSVSALREMIGNAVPPQFSASIVKAACGY